MEECYICFSNLEQINFKSLPCSHKICISCYIKLEKTKCPLCRKDFKYSKEDLNKRNELGIENKYNFPSAQQNYINRTRINDFNNFQQQYSTNRTIRRMYRDDYSEEENIGIVGRQRYKKRRRKLSEEEVKEKRKIIREKCKRKWTIKENRLSKINWYDINIDY